MISKIYIWLFVLILVASPSSAQDSRAKAKEEIFKAEEDFNNMAAEKGIMEAFYFFADEGATIKRGNDSLITGRDAIRNFYSAPLFTQASVTWKPDFVDVSSDGTMGYTYGKFQWKGKDKEEKPIEINGVFHTVWKKQPDGKWKYVWD